MNYSRRLWPSAVAVANNGGPSRLALAVGYSGWL